MLPVLSQSEDVFTLNLGDDENRFTSDWLDAVEMALDTVASSASAVLITTGGGKFYSNGLDVTEITDTAERREAYVVRVHSLLARILTLPVPTIAALNGHTFGAGAMFALAHDYRIMNQDKGFFCFPEVDIKIPFTPGMSALIQSKLDPSVALEVMTTGRRFDAVDAKDRKIVDQIGAGEEIPAAATASASLLTGKDTRTLGAIKLTMFAKQATALRKIPALG
jgi:enoyl-CoA hydratase/carnithine racemase